MYNNRSFAKFNIKDFEGALLDVNKSINLDSKNSFAYKVRANVYLEKKDNVNACKDLKKALELGYTKDFGSDVQELLDKNCK